MFMIYKFHEVIISNSVKNVNSMTPGETLRVILWHMKTLENKTGKNDDEKYCKDCEHVKPTSQNKRPRK